MGDLPLRTPTHRRLGGPLPRQLANAAHGHPQPELPPLIPGRCLPGMLRGIRRNFFRLSPCCGQVPYVLLTRAPVAIGSIATPLLPLDLHVLSLSLAFILSQDQTLRCCLSLFSSCLFLKRADGKGRRAVLFLVAFTETVAESCLTCSVEHRIFRNLTEFIF